MNPEGIYNYIKIQGELKQHCGFKLNSESQFFFLVKKKIKIIKPMELIHTY